MPSVPKIAQLPIEVRTELDRRLVLNGFSDMRGISEWLVSLGHKIGKTAVAEYAKANRDALSISLAKAAQQSQEMALRRAELRASLIKVAGQFPGSTTPESTMKAADALLAWVQSPD
jgi:hypothetical protein